MADELRQLAIGAITPLSGEVVKADYSLDSASLVIDYLDTPGELWSTAADPQRLATLDVAIPQGAFVAQGARMLARSATKEVYLLDVAWLQAMHVDPAALLEAELVRLACTMPLASELWTAADQAALVRALADAEPRACRNQTK